MTEDLFLQLLLKQSAARLRELRSEAEAAVERGQRDLRYIDKALEAKGGSTSTSTSTATPARSAARTRGPLAKATNTREPIKEIVASDPVRIWMPAKVTTELAKRYQIEAAVGTVRAAMKRLLDEGFFTRPAEGEAGFKLASSNGSGAEPNVEATNSGSEGYERQSALAPNDGLG